MDEKTKKNLEDTMNDCLDKAYACEADSEDYTKLINQAVAIGKVLNDDKEIECKMEVDLKKIENDSQITKKDLIVVGAPIVAGGLDLAVRMGFMNNMWRKVCNFEKTNSFTSSAGRWFSRTIGDLFSFRRRR